MNYKGHLTGGVITAIAPAAYGALQLDWKNAVLLYISSLWFALYPDMDTGSKPRRYLTIIGVIAVVLFIRFEMREASWLMMALIVTPSFFKHRGFTHTMLGMLIFGAVWVQMLEVSIGIDNGYAYGVAVCVGFLTHMLLDKHFRIFSKKY